MTKSHFHTTHTHTYTYSITLLPRSLSFSQVRDEEGQGASHFIWSWLREAFHDNCPILCRPSAWERENSFFLVLSLMFKTLFFKNQVFSSRPSFQKHNWNYFYFAFFVSGGRLFAFLKLEKVPNGLPKEKNTPWSTSAVDWVLLLNRLTCWCFIDNDLVQNFPPYLIYRCIHSPLCSLVIPKKSLPKMANFFSCQWSRMSSDVITSGTVLLLCLVLFQLIKIGLSRQHRCSCNLRSKIVKECRDKAVTKFVY